MFPFFVKKRISPVQLSDSGVYTCVARSRAGLAELSYDVQVQGIIITYHLLIFTERPERQVRKHDPSLI